MRLDEIRVDLKSMMRNLFGESMKKAYAFGVQML